MSIQYLVGAIGGLVTLIVAIGVYSYYEIERIAQDERNKKGN